MLSRLLLGLLLTQGSVLPTLAAAVHPTQTYSPLNMPGPVIPADSSPIPTAKPISPHYLPGPVIPQDMSTFATICNNATLNKRKDGREGFGCNVPQFCELTDNLYKCRLGQPGFESIGFRRCHFKPACKGDLCEEGGICPLWNQGLGMCRNEVCCPYTGAGAEGCGLGWRGLQNCLFGFIEDKLDDWPNHPYEEAWILFRNLSQIPDEMRCGCKVVEEHIPDVTITVSVTATTYADI